MGIVLRSNFTDYYDEKFDSQGVVYKRQYEEKETLFRSLKYIRNLYINTIELKQVTNMLDEDTNIIVYTSTSKEKGIKRKLMSAKEARKMYSNYVASEYYGKDATYTKYVQVGKKRFFIHYTCKENSLELEETGYTRLEDGYSPNLKFPIFSIDYVTVGSTTYAYDFNRVQKLQGTVIEKLITPEEVVEEIRTYIENVDIFNHKEIVE